MDIQEKRIYFVTRTIDFFLSNDLSGTSHRVIGLPSLSNKKFVI